MPQFNMKYDEDKHIKCGFTPKEQYDGIVFHPTLQSTFFEVDTFTVLVKFSWLYVKDFSCVSKRKPQSLNSLSTWPKKSRRLSCLPS